MKRLAPLVLAVFVVLVGAFAWMKDSRAPSDPKSVHVSRATTALAAVLEAAGQVADDDSVDVLRRYQIIPKVNPVVEQTFPQRRRLVEVVSGWSAEQKRSAFEWVRDHAVWSTLLHAMVIESFDASFDATAWGPSMSRYNSKTFEGRAGLSPLLREALADPAIAALAEELSQKPEPFTEAAVARRRSRLLEYLGRPDDLPAFDAFFAPLMPPGTGGNVELEDGSLLFLVGPRADPVEVGMILSHEMAHLPIFRTLIQPEVRAALESSACAFEKVEDDVGYSTWRGYFAESLVRSLSYRLEGLPAQETGFRFEAELYQDLEAWEQDGGDFGEAVVGMLGRIKEAHCVGVGVAAD